MRSYVIAFAGLVLPMAAGAQADTNFVPRELACQDYRAITLPPHFPGVEGPHKALVVDVTIPPRSHAAPPVHAGHRAGRG